MKNSSLPFSRKLTLLGLLALAGALVFVSPWGVLAPSWSRLPSVLAGDQYSGRAGQNRHPVAEVRGWRNGWSPAQCHGRPDTGIDSREPELGAGSNRDGISRNSRCFAGVHEWQCGASSHNCRVCTVLFRTVLERMQVILDLTLPRLRSPLRGKPVVARFSCAPNAAFAGHRACRYGVEQRRQQFPHITRTGW